MRGFLSKAAPSFLAGAVMVVVIVYGWLTGTKEQEKIATVAALSEHCPLEGSSVMDDRQNPNITLFVGCGGFLE